MMSVISGHESKVENADGNNMKMACIYCIYIEYRSKRINYMHCSEGTVNCFDCIGVQP